MTLDLSMAILIAYLIGSLSSAIIVCKAMQFPDPRTQGSMNPGASNVLRIAGKKAAVITLIGDVVKGIIPVLLGKWYGFPAVPLAIIATAAILGHLYPVFFEFEGGKGIATYAGTLLVLAWPVGLCFIIIWSMLAALSRYASVASIITTLLTPLLMWIFTKNMVFVGFSAILGVFFILFHRRNVLNLIAGQEHPLF